MTRRRESARRLTRPRRWRWRRSLRARLIAVFVVLALAMAVVFVGGMQRAVSSGGREALRPLVNDYVDRLALEIGSPPDVARAQALVDRLPLSVTIDGPRVHWASSAEAGASADAGTGAEAGSTPGRTTGGAGGDRDAGSFLRRGPFAREAREWLTRTTADGHRIVFGLEWPSIHRRSPGVAGLVTLLLMLLLIVAAYGYVRRQLRPLDDIRAGSARFGQGRFDEPIPERRDDELGHLASRINAMARDIAGMLDAKRGLLLALSHELRSPLTRARLHAELLPEVGAAAGQREALLRDLNHMRDLIADLLESERLAGPHATLQREPLDLPALSREVIDELSRSRDDPPVGIADDAGAVPPPGDAAPIALDLLGDWPPLMLDRTRMRLLLRNLLDNALRHGQTVPPSPAPSAGAGFAGFAVPTSSSTTPLMQDRRPRLSLMRDVNGAVLVAVRDFGPGVPPEELSRLAEPFHRSDHARQRATGGVGLGLYLARLVAEAHGGSLTPRLARPGLLMQVWLPPPGHAPADTRTRPQAATP